MVLRSETERPEAVRAGTVTLTGTDSQKIIQKTKELLFDHRVYQEMARAINPYGHGDASVRIAKCIEDKCIRRKKVKQSR